MLQLRLTPGDVQRNWRKYCAENPEEDCDKTVSVKRRTIENKGCACPQYCLTHRAWRWNEPSTRPALHEVVHKCRQAAAHVSRSTQPLRLGRSWMQVHGHPAFVTGGHCRTVPRPQVPVWCAWVLEKKTGVDCHDCLSITPSWRRLFVMACCTAIAGACVQTWAQAAFPAAACPGS